MLKRLREVRWADEYREMMDFLYARDDIDQDKLAQRMSTTLKAVGLKSFYNALLVADKRGKTTQCLKAWELNK